MELKHSNLLKTKMEEKIGSVKKSREEMVKSILQVNVINIKFNYFSLHFTGTIASC